MSRELTRCPVCHGKIILPEALDKTRECRYHIFYDRYSIRCKECGYRNMRWNNELSAIKDWEDTAKKHLNDDGKKGL